MSSTVEVHQHWFSEVIEPKIAQLREWSLSTLPLASTHVNAFFKELLIDLEVLNLDNYTVELYIEEIILGLRTLEHEKINQSQEVLKPLALMALLPSRFDRALFSEYWTSYRPFMKQHADIKDEALIHAFKLKSNFKRLADYIEHAKHEPSQEILD